MGRPVNNKIQLLIEYKMMESGWAAWTEDSYASYLWQLEDNEIFEFMNKTESEIEEIIHNVNEFYYDKVKE